MAARCATETFSPTCAVHIEDCGGWWLSSCCGSVAEHWRLKPEVSWVRLPATAGFFTFLYLRLITSKFIYFQREARCSEHICWLSVSYYVGVHVIVRASWYMSKLYQRGYAVTIRYHCHRSTFMHGYYMHPFSTLRIIHIPHHLPPVFQSSSVPLLPLCSLFPLLPCE